MASGGPTPTVRARARLAAFTRPGGAPGESTIDRTVSVSISGRNVRAEIIKALTHDWPVTDEGRLQVEHKIGARTAGKIEAIWVLTESPVSAATFPWGACVPLRVAAASPAR